MRNAEQEAQDQDKKMMSTLFMPGSLITRGRVSNNDPQTDGVQPTQEMRQ
jgi:hypothetical protein